MASVATLTSGVLVSPIAVSAPCPTSPSMFLYVAAGIKFGSKEGLLKSLVGTRS